jgi:hypothetical protein
VVLNAYSDVDSRRVLCSQPIDGVDAFVWLRTMRETANYTVPKFTEPDSPAHFMFVESNGLRKTINAYIEDEVYLYTFDPDHAILAFPLALMKIVLSDMSGTFNSLPAGSREYLGQLFRDESGSIASLSALIKQSI